MIFWRKDAIRLFPKFKEELNSKNYSIYQLFFDLIPELENAVKANDKTTIRKIFEFAELCLLKGSDDVSNASGVAFYEDIIKKEIVYNILPEWIKPEVFKEVYTLFELKLSKERYQDILLRYNKKHKTNFK